MAVTSLNITQDNIIEGSKVMPVHSPLVFIVNAIYTDDPPSNILVDVIKDGNTLATYNAIYLDDIAIGERRFVFKANRVIIGEMLDFDDVYQVNNSVINLENIIEPFRLEFRDLDGLATIQGVDCDFIHGAAQFGEQPNLVDISNNEDEVIYCPAGFYCYTYFYHNNEDDIITITTT